MAIRAAAVVSAGVAIRAEVVTEADAMIEAGMVIGGGCGTWCRYGDWCVAYSSERTAVSVQQWTYSSGRTAVGMNVKSPRWLGISSGKSYHRGLTSVWKEGNFRQQISRACNSVFLYTQI